MSDQTNASQSATNPLAVDVEHGPFRALVGHHLHQIARARGEGHWTYPIEALTGMLKRRDSELMTSQAFSGGFELGIAIALATLREPLGNPQTEIAKVIDWARSSLEKTRSENAEREAKWEAR